LNTDYKNIEKKGNLLSIEEERFPGCVNSAGCGFDKKYMIRSKRFYSKFHARFVGSSIAFFIIARQTSRHQVFPSIGAASRFGNNMVNR
jgi:hypothetical protein